jgi:regulator of replication initiation timing
MPTLNELPGYNQDRLIASIAIIKEVLLSNMQLREDLLNLSQEHERVVQQNFQFTVENEDLRDRMSLLGKGEAVSIDYLPYMPPMHLEKVIEAVNNREELEAAKSLILSYYFSL